MKGRLSNRLTTLSKRWRENRYIKRAIELVHELFIVLLITFLLLLLVESIWDQSVSPYLNLDYLLIAVIALGVVVVLTRPERVNEEKGQLERRDIVTVVCAGVAATTFVWYKTKEIGWLSYVISVISGALIVLLFLLTWREEDEGEDIQSH